MPRDSRLYMTFPIELPEHPKIKPLSDAAFRVFIEINAYSRRLGLDGRVPVAAARATWKSKALAELIANHPERPTLSLEDDVYVIHNYADHQLTNADIEDLRKKRAEAGQKGGKAAALARANAEQTSSAGVPESESESESGLSPTQDTHIRLVTETGLTDDRTPVDNSAHWAEFGITDIGQIRRAIVTAIGHAVTEPEAGRIVGWIMAKAEQSGTKPDSMQAYLLGAIRKSWSEVQQYYHEAIAS